MSASRDGMPYTTEAIIGPCQEVGSHGIERHVARDAAQPAGVVDQPLLVVEPARQRGAGKALACADILAAADEALAIESGPQNPKLDAADRRRGQEREKMTCRLRVEVRWRAWPVQPAPSRPVRAGWGGRARSRASGSG